MPAKTRRSRSESEADFQAWVMDIAQVFRWRRVHIRNVRNYRGTYEVPYAGHNGLPDLVLARGGRVILVELKSERGKVTPDQQAWIDAAGPNGYIWRPSDRPEVLRVLGYGPRSRPASPETGARDSVRESHRCDSSARQKRNEAA